MKKVEVSDFEFVVPDVSVTNESDGALAVSLLLQMTRKDDTGLGYLVSIVGTSALDKAFSEGSEIAPGDTRRGEMAYVSDRLNRIYEFIASM